MASVNVTKLGKHKEEAISRLEETQYWLNDVESLVNREIDISDLGDIETISSLNSSMVSSSELLSDSISKLEPLLGTVKLQMNRKEEEYQEVLENLHKTKNIIDKGITLLKNHIY